MEENQFDDLREKEIVLGGKTLVMREMAGAIREKYDALISLMGKYELRLETAETIEDAEKAGEDLSRLRGRLMQLWFPEEDGTWLESQRTKERFINLLLDQIILNKDEELSKKMMSQVAVK
jgi:hypothetical protein